MSSLLHLQHTHGHTLAGGRQEVIDAPLTAGWERDEVRSGAAHPHAGVPPEPRAQPTASARGHADAPAALPPRPSRDRWAAAARPSLAGAAALGVLGTALTAGAAAAATGAGSVALHFTPAQAALGGLVLGAAAAGKLLVTGRVLGISGAVKGLLAGVAAPWRAAFLGGMLAASVAMHFALPGAFEVLPATYTMQRALLGGLLVGLGSALGNGCTSGHGICGNARLSPRSMVYTLTFMGAGAVAATAADTAAALSIAPVHASYQAITVPELQLGLGALAVTVAIFAALAAALRRPDGAAATGSVGGQTAELAAEATAGVAFAVGLGLSGMTHPSKIAAFLCITNVAWDPSLMFVMGGALAVAAVAFAAVRNRAFARPLASSCPTFGIPTSTLIDGKLLTGGVLFGAGWGVSGMCPGPAIVAAGATLSPPVLAFLAAMAAGMAAEPLAARLLAPDAKAAAPAEPLRQSA